MLSAPQGGSLVPADRAGRVPLAWLFVGQGNQAASWSPNEGQKWGRGQCSPLCPPKKEAVQAGAAMPDSFTARASRVGAEQEPTHCNCGQKQPARESGRLRGGGFSGTSKTQKRLPPAELGPWGPLLLLRPAVARPGSWAEVSPTPLLCSPFNQRGCWGRQERMLSPSPPRPLPPAGPPPKEA